VSLGAEHECIVLGAGLAGLSAAYHLGAQTQVFEAADQVGGECITDQVDGYAFDKSGHLLHLRTPEVNALVNELLPDGFNSVIRDARIHILGTEVRFPFQANTFGLPPLVKAQCLRSYLEAITQPGHKPANFTLWAQQSFGKEISRLFFEPYNQKLWNWPTDQMTLDWMGPYVVKPDLPTVISGAFQDQPAGGGYNATFLYPKHGGIDALPKALAAKLTNVHLQSPAVKINLARRVVHIQGTGSLSWKHLISSVPLPALAAMLDPLPAKVAEAMARLNANSVLVVNLGISRPKIHPAHWLYFPEKEFHIYRAGFPSNFGEVAPAGCSSIYAEVSLPAGTGWSQRRAHARRVRADLVRAGILRVEDKVEVEHFQYLPYAYVIYDRDYAQARKTVLAHLEKNGVQCVGRWGHWEYSAMEDAILAGKQAAEAVSCKKSGI